MPNTIWNGNPWKSKQPEDNTHRDAWKPKAHSQNGTDGYPEHSHYTGNHGHNTWSGKVNEGHGRMPHSDDSKYNHEVQKLANSYSGHAAQSSSSSSPSDSSSASGPSNLNGSSTSLSGPSNLNGSSSSTSSSGRSNPNGSSSSSTSGSSSTNGTSGSSGSTSSNASGMGVQLNFAGGDTISSYEQRTGVKPKSVGGYISANNGTLDMTSAQSYIQQAGQSGVPTVQLSISCGEKGAMSPQELSQFTQLSQQAKSAGVNLQVRFGYEMNNSSVSGYSDPNTFKQQWDQVAGAVHAGGGQMVWSPSNSTQSDYQKWMPDPSTIDVVGLDVYHMGSGPIQPNEVKDAISGIESVPGLSGKPVTLPETGVQLAGDGSDSSKVSQWLSQLSDPSLKAQFPNYQGFMWFDYNKPGDGNYALSQNPQYEQALTQWYNS